MHHIPQTKKRTKIPTITTSIRKTKEKKEVITSFIEDRISLLVTSSILENKQSNARDTFYLKNYIRSLRVIRPV